MRRFLLTMMLILLFLVSWQAVALPGPVTAQSQDWTPGQYQGWVYFLARSDFDYNLNQQDVTVKDTATLFHESHGTIECTVSDAAGNGACSGVFPLEKLAGRLGAFTSPGCNATWTESVHALGIDLKDPLAPLTSSSLADGFSIPFIPASGPAYAEMKVDASGGPTCRSQAISTQTNIGIPKWPDLDFYIAYHTALMVGGTCSMKDFPRKMTVGHAVTSAAIEQCEWRMFFYDPYAKLP
jgi:hypothetical protein